MWQQLAIGGLKGLMDRQNQLKDIESNVITQKYSPWTGQRADFSSIGKSPMTDGLMKGLGAGLSADAAADADTKAAIAKKSAIDKADGDWYEKHGAEIGGKSPAVSSATPVAATSAFQVPARTPAAAPVEPAQLPVPEAAKNASSFADVFPVSIGGQTPLPMQQQEDPAAMWAKIAGIKNAPYTQPSSFRPAMTPSPSRSFR